jgi:hypothetical protein
MLLVGNSFTSFNGGLGAQLERLAPSIRTETIAVGGATLKDHWTTGTASATIRAGGWDYVVLQDQSVDPVFSTPEFYTYGQDFITAIRAAGAQPVLLMTWERPDAVTAGVTTAKLAGAYEGLGAATGAAVAPAGWAFATSLKQRPDIPLNADDGHPTAAGTYLAACVLYRTMFGADHVSSVARDPSLPEDVQDHLKRIAAGELGPG